MAITLGDEVRDRITGFKGIVVSRTEWVSGCVRVAIQAQELFEGKPVEPAHFDEEQVEVVTAAKIAGLHKTAITGGNRAASPRANDSASNRPPGPSR